MGTEATACLSFPVLPLRLVRGPLYLHMTTHPPCTSTVPPEFPNPKFAQHVVLHPLARTWPTRNPHLSNIVAPSMTHRGYTYLWTLVKKIYFWQFLKYANTPISWLLFHIECTVHLSPPVKTLFISCSV
jgi:hypothetical protein